MQAAPPVGVPTVPPVGITTVPVVGLATISPVTGAKPYAPAVVPPTPPPSTVVVPNQVSLFNMHEFREFYCVVRNTRKCFTLN